MAYLLDTCAWLHTILEPERLSPAARRVIEKETPLYLSAISLLEAAILTRLGRIRLQIDFENWLNQIAIPTGKIKVLPIDPPTAARSQNLPGDFLNLKGETHGDPFDRVIAATANLHGHTLLTSDRVLLAYPQIKTLCSKR
jgi:PIN domain nuclease of toxin-antitoxin system